MAKGSLTKRSVSSLPVPEAGRNFLWDTRISGFGMFVTPSGHRSYVLQYRMSGRAPTKRFTIGRHGSPWTPAQARERAIGLLWKITQGVDPMEEKKATRETARVNEQLRFSAYLETFMTHHVEAKRLKTANEAIQVMRDYILPRFRKHVITSITKKEVVDLLDAVSKHSGSAANKVFDWLRTMFNFARRRGDVEISPLDGLRRPHKTKRRERVLQEWELQRTWEAASDLGYPDGAYAQMLLLTAQRPMEVGGACWGEFNLTDGNWIIPGSRTKNGLPQLVPLTDTMVSFLNQYWPEDRRRGLLFTASTGKIIKSTGRQKKRLDAAISRRVKAAAGPTEDDTTGLAPFVFHDIRRSVATGLQALGTPIEHIEALLNHVTGTHTGNSEIVRVYQLYRYAPEKKAALSLWHAHLERLLARPDAWPGGRDLTA
nr:site-specific integrase [Sphingosinicella sp. YJ22]